MTIRRGKQPHKLHSGTEPPDDGGAKTLTLDTKTNHILTMAAEYGPPPAPAMTPATGAPPQGRGGRGPMVPDSFSIIGWENREPCIAAGIAYGLVLIKACSGPNCGRQYAAPLAGRLRAAMEACPVFRPEIGWSTSHNGNLRGVWPRSLLWNVRFPVLRTSAGSRTGYDTCLG